MENELRMKIQLELVDHDELNKYLDQYMKDRFPEFDPSTFENNEHAELIYHGLRNEMFLSFMMNVLAGMKGN